MQKKPETATCFGVTKVLVKKNSFHVFKQETLIYAPLSQVFDFFSKVENLERLTPPNLKIQILTPLPVTMAEGLLIDYRISLFGVPFKWRTRIGTWEPEWRFRDSQLKGPYTLWEHTHTFNQTEEGTHMEDEVHYAFWGWILEPLVHRFIVEPQIRAIFAFRTRAIREAFAEGPRQT